MRWFSRAQRVTASASSESEYVTPAEILNETKFILKVQDFILSSLKSYAIPHVEDNQGSTRRTRHIDDKHHVVRDAVVCAKNEDRHTYILTKVLDMR